MKIIIILTKSITFNTFLKFQSDYFAKMGLKVEVGCSDPENLNIKNIPKHKINFPNKITQLLNLVNYFKIYLQIKKLIKNNPKTIFYLHTPVASYLFRLFNIFQKLKIIYFVHGFRFTSKTNYIKSIFFKCIEKILSYKTGVFITINNEDYNYAKYNLKNKGNVFKINGVGLNLRNKSNQKLHFNNKIRKILVISAYKKEKGYQDVLNVAEMLGKHKINITCYGYGDNKIYEQIKIKKKLKNIRFNNFDRNLENKIKNYDILLHLSKREGLPVAIMQSLLNGLPVICYNIRGNNDLIEDTYNGYFINSCEEVLQKINYLNLETNIFSKMKINALNTINKNFSKDLINSNLFKIIKNYNKSSK